MFSSPHVKRRPLAVDALGWLHPLSQADCMYEKSAHKALPRSSAYPSKDVQLRKSAGKVRMKHAQHVAARCAPGSGVRLPIGIASFYPLGNDYIERRQYQRRQKN